MGANPAETWGVVCAGGRGLRAGGVPKQFRDLGGRTVLRRAVDALAPLAGRIVVVANDVTAVAAAGVAPGQGGVAAVVPGGVLRRDSVAAGLRALPGEALWVAVHDAARPLATPALLERTLAALGPDVDGAVPAVEAGDTIKRVTGDGVVVETLDRGLLVRVQTPQCFRAGVLRRAHAEVAGDAPDDAALVEAIGGRVVTVAGDPENLKVTHAHDLAVAAAILDARGSG